MFILLPFFSRLTTYILHLSIYFIFQAKEAEGTDTSIPDDIRKALTELTPELLRPLSVSQLKEVRVGLVMT